MPKKPAVTEDNDEYDYEEPENDEPTDDEVTDSEMDESEEENIDESDDEDKCKIEEVIESDEKYFNEMELGKEQVVDYVKKEDRISANRMTKYELVRILSERVKQLSTGAKPLIKNYKDLPSYEKIAQEEIKLNMVPFKIKRPLPSGKFEIWTLDELKKDHLMFLLDLN
jgi:DNA-directed RNA polymerase subunit K/omega